jgi:hypothetical protein
MASLRGDTFQNTLKLPQRYMFPRAFWAVFHNFVPLSQACCYANVFFTLCLQ